MPRFPTDAPKNRVIRALERLGYRIIRERNHICMARENPDGSRSVLVLPNHRRIKAQLCAEFVPRQEFPEMLF